MAIIAIILATGLQTAYAQTGQPDQLVLKARETVLKQGLGRDARVEVRLRDRTKLKGYISASGDDSFTLTDSKTGTSQTLAYTNVEGVKKQGGGLSTRTWVIIGAAAAAAVIVGMIAKPAFCDGGAQDRFPC
ncbi:MAG TPA: hypothetical protein VGB17_14305 [Pyrinomonadaceae bacterium]